MPDPVHVQREAMMPTRFCSWCAVSAVLLVMSQVTSDAAGGRAPQDRTDGDARFRVELTALAAKCDELGLKEEAATTRAWVVPRDPHRHYLFLPPAEDPARPAGDATKLVTLWYAKFSAARRRQAERLFRLAREQAESGSEGAAFRLLHELLREDPDHAEARRILEYARGERDWRRPIRRSKLQRNRSAHPLLGWPGDQYWVVDSEHFEVSTNHNARAARQVAEYLERVHAAWQQLFYEYWTVPGRLTSRFRGENVSLGPERTFEVVLFKDRADYVGQLSRSEPQIELSVGYYSQNHKTAFFYAGDESARTTWVHEATHQFFQESGEAAPMVGERSNFWVVEGVALYMESLADQGGYLTTGGVDADRLQYARYRLLNEDYYVPLETLMEYGREQVQKDADLPKLYSQCAGLAHFFMDTDRSERIRPFINYLRTVYRGTGQLRTLSGEFGQSYGELDQRYRGSLGVTDDELAYVDRRVRNLCLGHTRVTDAGLSHVRGLDQLLWLDLSFTGTGDAGLANFAEAQQLTQLNLEETRITSAGLDMVGAFLQLEELDLSRTALADDDLPRLARLTRLKVLWLTGTQITDAGLAALAPLRNLEQLDVANTAVTPEGLENLKKRLPKLK
jgi:hypothetical protein